MAKTNTKSLTVGNATVQSTYIPWIPPTTTWPTYYPTIYYTSSDDYANEVEVDQYEHDATLRFYRRKGEGRTLVKEITVPLPLLEWMQGESI